MYAREPEEEIVFLSDAFLSHVPESGAHVPRYRSWIDGQDFAPAYAYLHRMLQFLQWQKRRRGLTRDAVGAEVACAPGISGQRCAPSSPICTSCTCIATRSRRSRRARASTRRCTRCTADTVDRHRVGAEWLRTDGLDQRPRDGYSKRLGRRDRAVHRHRVRRRGGRSDRPGGPRVRRDRADAHVRSGGGDAPLAGRSARARRPVRRTRPTTSASATTRSTSGSRPTTPDSAPVQSPRGGSDVRFHRRSGSDGVATRTGAGCARTDRVTRR